MSTSKNILIVDHSLDNQQLICSLFKRSAICFIPTYASSLEEAREKLAQEKFDIITLDDIFPNILGNDFGYSLIPEIRNGMSKDAIIIIFSGGSRYLEEGLLLGADKAYSKSFLTTHVRFDECFNLVSVPVKK